ncbi:MAG: hypothetical protein D6692_10835 [Planctomycetota bacterium]|nr:MAG: hypothetical protein D6692_10835 [Planctomycetota bacterium]
MYFGLSKTGIAADRAGAQLCGFCERVVAGCDLENRWIVGLFLVGPKYPEKAIGHAFGDSDHVVHAGLEDTILVLISGCFAFFDVESAGLGFETRTLLDVGEVDGPWRWLSLFL